MKKPQQFLFQKSPVKLSKRIKELSNFHDYNQFRENKQIFQKH